MANYSVNIIYKEPPPWGLPIRIDCDEWAIESDLIWFYSVGGIREFIAKDIVAHLHSRDLREVSP